MIIVYHCYGGTHSSVTAAALHLKKLHQNPTANDLLKLPLFDKVNAADWGRLFYHGKDCYGNLVYTMGRGKRFKLIEMFYQSLLEVCPEGTIKEVVFIDTLPYVNMKMRIGGFLSRHLGFVYLGRPLTAIGTLEILPNIRKKVNEILDSCK